MHHALLILNMVNVDAGLRETCGQMGVVPENIRKRSNVFHLVQINQVGNRQLRCYCF